MSSTPTRPDTVLVRHHPDRAVQLQEALQDLQARSGLTPANIARVFGIPSPDLSPFSSSLTICHSQNSLTYLLDGTETEYINEDLEFPVLHLQVAGRLETRARIVTPESTNLLLDILFANPYILSLLLSTQILREQLASFPTFTSLSDILTALHSHPWNHLLNLLLIGHSYSGTLVPALGGLRVTSLPTSISQFVILQHPPELQARFDSSLRAAGGISTFLFHGTSKKALLSILNTGLQPSRGRHPLWGRGIHMSEHPWVAKFYARQSLPHDEDNEKERSMYEGCSVILACEVAGYGRRVSWEMEANDQMEPGTHVMQDLGGVLVKYVWVLPKGYVGDDFMRRGDVMGGLMAGCDLIDGWNLRRALRSGDESEAR
ncbi:hypothetical protein B0J14DRAFT_51820 [Halenospora varia]|nr:hypothetical protein B0J14DRAFT_51820 [Halenospora varia]